GAARCATAARRRPPSITRMASRARLPAEPPDSEQPVADAEDARGIAARRVPVPALASCLASAARVDLLTVLVVRRRVIPALVPGRDADGVLHRVRGIGRAAERGDRAEYSCRHHAGQNHTKTDAPGGMRLDTGHDVPLDAAIQGGALIPERPLQIAEPTVPPRVPHPDASSASPTCAVVLTGTGGETISLHLIGRRAPGARGGRDGGPWRWHARARGRSSSGPGRARPASSPGRARRRPRRPRARRPRGPGRAGRARARSGRPPTRA